MEHNVPEVQRHFFGSGEGQAAVRTGLCGERRTSVQVMTTSHFY